jgi:hypothetical protein
MKKLFESLLKPSLYSVTSIIEKKKLCGITVEAIVEEYKPRSRLKNVMYQSFVPPILIPF